jgi:hypothetical protein
MRFPVTRNGPVLLDSHLLPSVDLLLDRFQKGALTHRHSLSPPGLALQLLHRNAHRRALQLAQQGVFVVQRWADEATPKDLPVVGEPGPDLGRTNATASPHQARCKPAHALGLHRVCSGFAPALVRSR